MYDDDLRTPGWWLHDRGDGVPWQMGEFAPKIFGGVGRVIEVKVRYRQPPVPY